MFLILNILLMWLLLAKGEEEYKFHLPKMVVPTHYTLNITPNLNTLTFRGDVTIQITVLEPVSYIVFHMKDLHIPKGSDVHLEYADDVTYRRSSMIQSRRGFETESANIYKMTFSQNIEKGEYQIVIPEFNGSFQNEDLLEGFYRGKYDENGRVVNFGTSLCEPTHARQIFPCFDEPYFRATFKVYIIRPLGFIAYTNGNQIGSRYIRSCDGYEDEFAKTEIMSTYSLVIIVTNNKMVLSKIRKDNINRVLAQSRFLNSIWERYAIETSNKILKQHEKFLKVTCPLKELIHAAIPSDYMRNDGVKNWGLITYKEDILLFYNNNNAVDKERCNLLIACEIAHMWFGNIVGLSSWDYTWLNEGFGTYMAYKIIDMINPTWLVTERLLGFIQEALYEDSLGVAECLNEPALTSPEIAGKFNLITKFKGAALIRMMEAILGTEVFAEGLNNYIQNTLFGIASPQTLYENLQMAADESFVKFPRSLDDMMSIWDGESGYPLVFVKRQYPNIHFVQSEYASTRQYGRDEAVWCIPINFASEQNQSFPDTRPSHWLEYERLDITEHKVEHHHWLVVNKQQAYYYRVNYDDRNWELLASALQRNHKHIHTLNRMQLIDDAFDLAQNGHISYDVPLKLIKYIKSEREYGPFNSLKRSYNLLKGRLRGTSLGKEFDDIVQTNILDAHTFFTEKAQLRQLDHSEVLTQDLLSSWLCEMNSIRCKKDARRTLNKSNRSRTSNNNLQVYKNLIHALTGSRLDLLEALHSVLQEGFAVVELPIKFIQANFITLLERLGEKDLQDFLTLLGKKIVTTSQLQMLVEISQKYQIHKELFRSAIKVAKLNINWKKKYQTQIGDYIHRESKSVSGAGTNSPIAIFVFVFNIFIIKIICY